MDDDRWIGYLKFAAATGACPSQGVEKFLLPDSPCLIRQNGGLLR